ncbi:flagellar hook capping FlgD N-terminal domain-containing protein [Telmatospirillum sp.]|uniref:flagellar hook assembly protein FlgD n=1 Tax=Telmatospirillum sp. TaxID=2079197 RepID=UPI002850771E|nr:flagellar hook capping FlgD N-terminal domain-containing protein [Telmatospirillum sp.]MDR3438540.1 flagellar hook capping FlgD N-terminal domain-containing protein [Telmatospirillum sp.]
MTSAINTSNTAGSSTSTSSSTAATSASASYNTFLTLLTTQLKNQDPLNPTNTDTFTSEMIQLSGVEQELAINDTLGTISTNLNSVATSNGLGYIGKTVTASGTTSPMQSGTVKWTYTLDSAASNVKLTVKDSSGDTVYTTTGDATSGTHSFSWDGKTTSGSTESTGDFTLSVAASDTSGDDVSTSTDLVGTVTGVDSSSGTTKLKIGDIEVSVSKVSSINS